MTPEQRARMDRLGPSQLTAVLKAHPCPSCYAPAGYPCRSARGDALAWCVSHVRRIRLAWAAL